MATADDKVLTTSLHGRRIGLAPEGNLVGPQGNISSPCVHATIVVGAEAANVRAITIQLLDGNGNDIDYAEMVEAYVFTDANRTTVSPGGSTGIAIGTDGMLFTVVAKQAFKLVSESDGDLDLTYTDTGTDAAMLHLRLPNGRWIVSDDMTNA